MKKYRIIVDTREASIGSKRGGMKIFKGLLKYKDIKVDVQNLGQCVDYAIPSLNGLTHIIQRKTATEMINKKSVLDDVRGMLKIPNTSPYLLLEGSLSSIQKFSRWPPEPIIGLVESVLEDFNVKIIPSPNYFYTIKWLVARARRLGKIDEKKVVKLGYTVDLSLPIYEQARRILETFPQIGPTFSVKILKKYVTLKNALDNIDDWRNSIKGIGEKKIRKISDILYARYEKI